MKHLIPPALLLASTALFACDVDNSGGDEPSGTPVSFEILREPRNECPDEDAGGIVTSVEDAEDILGVCGLSDGFYDSDLATHLYFLEEGTILVAIRMGLPACTGDFYVHGMYLDGETLRPWILKQDGQWGRLTSCLPGYDSAVVLVAVQDAEVARDIELHVGYFNPGLDGRPEITGFNIGGSQ
jgi:hypothetical protein